MELFEEQKDFTEAKNEGVESYDDLKVEVTNKWNLTTPQYEEKFESLKLAKALSDNIDRCRYERLTIIQKHSVPLIMSGINVMAASQTGSGKTAAFLIPIIQNLLEKGPPNPDVNLADYKKCKNYLLLVIE